MSNLRKVYPSVPVVTISYNTYDHREEDNDTNTLTVHKSEPAFATRNVPGSISKANFLPVSLSKSLNFCYDSQKRKKDIVAYLLYNLTHFLHIRVFLGRNPSHLEPSACVYHARIFHIAYQDLRLSQKQSHAQYSAINLRHASIPLGHCQIRYVYVCGQHQYRICQ